MHSRDTDLVLHTRASLDDPLAQPHSALSLSTNEV